MIGRRWKMSTVSTSNGILYLSHRLFFFFFFLILIIIFSSLSPSCHVLFDFEKKTLERGSRVYSLLTVVVLCDFPVSTPMIYRPLDVIKQRSALKQNSQPSTSPHPTRAVHITLRRWIDTHPESKGEQQSRSPPPQKKVDGQVNSGKN